jgi:Tfp pilus assembly protein FimV
LTTQSRGHGTGKVEQLRGVSYELKSNGKHEVGVIAEEVGAVVPEIVTWDQNGKDAQSVDYSRLTALLIEATKEQQAVIQQQQEQMKTQQEQIAQLTSQVKTIQASLKTSGRTGSEVRTINANLRTVHQ